MSLVSQIFLFIPGEWCGTSITPDNKENDLDFVFEFFVFEFC